MAHQEQFDYTENLRQRFPEFFKEKKVLEIGSLNINGTIKGFFDKCDYTGVDLEPGYCVDVVCEGQNYDAPDETFDTVFSAECFEHNPYWKETFLNMIRMCKKDGLVFFTCATDGREEHGTSNHKPEDSPFTIQKGWNYYKNLNQSHFEDLNLEQYFSEYGFEVNSHSKDLYFYGIKNNQKKDMLSIFYHLFIPNTSGMWVWWINEQLGLLKKTGLSKKAKVNVCITMPLALSGELKVGEERIIKNYDQLVSEYIIRKYPFVDIISYRDINAQENIYEGQTLKELYDYSLKNEGYVLYFHNKGITNSSYIQHGLIDEDKKWRQYMQKHCIENWEECIQKLNDGYDVIGSNFYKDYYPFAGNFWWAKTDYIKTLSDPLNINKYYSKQDNKEAYKKWIGSGNGKLHYIHVRQEKAPLSANPVVDNAVLKEVLLKDNDYHNQNSQFLNSSISYATPATNKFNMCRIVPDNHFNIHSNVFHEIEAAVFFTLQRMGYEVTNSVNEFRQDARNIVFGMHHCPVDMVRHDVPKNTIIYSLEQMRDSPECLRWCRKYRGLEVWDYSMRNSNILRKAGVDNIKHVQIGYVPEISYFERNKPEERDIDILAYMYTSDRRIKILNQFAENKNINFVHFHSVYGDDRDAYIKRAKLVINLHNHENKIFEMVRVSHLIQNKVPVLCERSSETDFPDYMEGTVFTTTYENFVEKAYELLKNPQELDLQAEKGLDIFKKTPMENFIREALK
jgi:SAM-dependent methyltransferase